MISELLDSDELTDTDSETSGSFPKWIADNQVVKDPFNLTYAKLYEHIFKNLDVKDILNLSETCKAFYKLTGEICDGPMKRIKFVVNETLDRSIEGLTDSSTRNYRHLEINKVCSSFPEVIAFLQNCAHSLVTIRTNYEFSPGIELPALQELFYYGHNYGSSRIKFAVRGLVSSAWNLKSLTIWSGAVNPGVLADCISDCEFLQKFVLQGVSTGVILSALDLRIPFNFNLRTFHVGLEQGTFLEYHLSHILASQSLSIRDLKFSGSIELITEVLATFPRLERLTYSQQGDYEGELLENFAVPLKSDTLIEANFILIDHDFLECFLELNDELETLYVAYLDNWKLYCVWMYGINVKLLKYACVEPFTTVLDLNEELARCQAIKPCRRPFQIVQI